MINKYIWIDDLDLGERVGVLKGDFYDDLRGDVLPTEERIQAEVISEAIRDFYFNGFSWHLDFDRARFNENSVDTQIDIVNAIADFIIEGRYEGMSPWWKLHSKIDLDENRARILHHRNKE